MEKSSEFSFFGPATVVSMWNTRNVISAEEELFIVREGFRENGCAICERAPFPISFPERNRATRYEPSTYFRQATCGLHLRGRDVRIVCSCVSRAGDSSANSAASSHGAERDGANDQRTPARRPRFHFHYEAGEALRLRSFTLVRKYVCTYIRACARVRMRRVRTHLTRASVLFFYRTLVIARKNRKAPRARARAGQRADSQRDAFPRKNEFGCTEPENEK